LRTCLSKAGGMNETIQLSLQASDWLHLFLHYMSLSLLSLGGALAAVPEMHRYLVAEQHWLSEPQFSTSITIAQAAPGPNILFVALMGWNIGLNAGGMASGLLGMALSMISILLPSTAFTYMATRWVHRNRGTRIQIRNGTGGGRSGICDWLDFGKHPRRSVRRLPALAADGCHDRVDIENPHTHCVATGCRCAALLGWLGVV